MKKYVVMGKAWVRLDVRVLVDEIQGSDVKRDAVREVAQALADSDGIYRSRVEAVGEGFSEEDASPYVEE